MNIHEHIERNQGVDYNGRTFGYDHKRHNFITWAIDNDKIIVAKIDNDEEEENHGSKSETEREAKSIAARENRLPNSQLRRAILKGFQRD